VPTVEQELLNLQCYVLLTIVGLFVPFHVGHCFVCSLLWFTTSDYLFDIIFKLFFIHVIVFLLQVGVNNIHARRSIISLFFSHLGNNHLISEMLEEFENNYYVQRNPEYKQYCKQQRGI
jgi:hypothetical protein